MNNLPLQISASQNFPKTRKIIVFIYRLANGKIASDTTYYGSTTCNRRVFDFIHEKNVV